MPVNVDQIGGKAMNDFSRGTIDRDYRIQGFGLRTLRIDQPPARVPGEPADDQNVVSRRPKRPCH